VLTPQLWSHSLYRGSVAQASSGHCLILYAGLACRLLRSLLQVFFRFIMSSAVPLILLDPYLQYISDAAAKFSHLAASSRNWSNLWHDSTGNYSCWWADYFHSHNPDYLSIEKDHTSNVSRLAYEKALFWVPVSIWSYSLYKVVIGDGWRRGGRNQEYRWIHAAIGGCIWVEDRWGGLSRRCYFWRCLVASKPSFNFKKY